MRFVPKHFQEKVRRYDPSLRLRWSYERKEFCLERKVPPHLRRDMEEPVRRFKTDNDFIKEIVLDPQTDASIAYREGYAPLFWIRKLDNRILDMLFHGDAWKVGAKRWISRLHDLEEKKQKRIEKEEHERFLEVGDKAYSKMCRLSGHSFIT